jgi:hypothetical protein
VERRSGDKAVGGDRLNPSPPPQGLPQSSPQSQKLAHQELAQLVRKLRWIGLEQEAKQLEAVIDTLPAEQRSSVSCGPFSTD